MLSNRLIKDSFWGVNVRIAMALGKIGGDQARDGLLKGLKKSHPKVRHGIILALGTFKNDPKVRRALRKIALGDPSYRVEAAALNCLGRIKDSDSRKFLENSFDRPSHNNITQSAILDALAQIEDESSWDFLAKNAEYGAPTLSRASAMKAIAKIAQRYPHRKKEALDLLIRFATETPNTPAAAFRAKLGAIQAIQILDDLAAVPVLRKAVDNETDGRLQRRAEDAISALRASAKKSKELREIRLDLDDVIKENKSLRERVDLFEKKEETKQPEFKKRKSK